MGKTHGQTKGGAGEEAGRNPVEGSDEAARLPSLEEQTPGLDRAQEQATLRDAKAFYGGESGRASDDENNDAPMSEQDIKEAGEQRH